MNELIAIIVPIYKVEDYLRRCVDSILRQTYKNLEIILVDDGSPDNCGNICDDYAKLDKRVKVIHKKNGGLSDARNAGIEIAQGEYISFLDSDDWIHEEYIEKLYKLLKDTNSDISVCNYIRTSTENIQVDFYKEEIYELSNIQALEKIYDSNFNVQMIVTWGKLYKKNLFENIRFPVERIHEDEFTTYKLIYKSNRLILTSEQLLYYWQRENSITGAGFNLRHRFDVLDAFEERAEFFNNCGLNELSNKAYETLFFLYINTIKKIDENKIIVNKKEANMKSKKLRKLLRKSRQKLKIKIFYELYFIAPWVMYNIYRLYIIHKNDKQIINKNF